MTWSIILASRNGEGTLPLTLAALASVERPKEGLEIILVDNASLDRTGGILGKFADKHGARRLFEPRCGKSHALNTAVACATGEMLVFMDDDVIVSPGWLRAFEAAAESAPDAAVFAGQIRPHWLSTPPQWLEFLASIGRACGCTDPQARAGPYPATHVKGANFAIRRAALGRHRFNTGEVNFGSGAGAVGGEDTSLVSALELEGKGIVHVPDAIVAHIVDTDEMSLRSVIRRFIRIGRGECSDVRAQPLRIRQACCGSRGIRHHGPRHARLSTKKCCCIVHGEARHEHGPAGLPSSRPSPVTRAVRAVRAARQGHHHSEEASRK